MTLYPTATSDHAFLIAGATDFNAALADAIRRQPHEAFAVAIVALRSAGVYGSAAGYAV